jgi:hypothetical protein
MSRGSQDKLSTSKNNWDQEVKEAEEMVKDARAWLADAEATLAVCRENKDRGEPYPGQAGN